MRKQLMTAQAGGVLLMGAAALLSACGAAVPPKELNDARAAYSKVEKGPAAAVAPAELDTAKQALARAEGSFQENGDTPQTRDLAYVAERKALLAQSQAGLIQATREREAIDKDLKKTQAATLDKTQEELKATSANLEKEQKARLAAEKSAAAAMASLNEIAKVQNEARGVVITLSGSVLFATGKSELLPIAKDKLNEVAKALKDQGFKAITIEGHTDSQGSATKNDELSRNRAESVRTHLVSQGIPADKVKAVGVGSSRPVAENSTPEGRANNRRVELVVTPDH